MKDKRQSIEDYLEAIYFLNEKKDFVRAIDIAELLHFSKPSVSIALKKLKELELVESNTEHDYIILTNKGLLIANKVVNKHNVLTSFLKSLGISEENSLKDACKLEHIISEETFQAIEKIVKK